MQSIPFNTYPRTYLLSPGWKLLNFVGGTLFVGGGLAFDWYVSDGLSKAPGAILGLYGVSLFFIGLGVLAFLLAMRTKMTLNADSIEVTGTMSVRCLRRNEIAGRRLVRVRNSTPILELIPKQSDQKPLRVPSMLQTDSQFQEWISTIPDQDANDLRQFEAQIALNESLGKSPEERKANLERIRKLVMGANVAGYAVGMWGWIYPRPYEVVIILLVILPLFALALAWVSKGLLQLDQRKGDLRPSLAGLLFTPAIVLAMRAYSDYPLLDWRQALLYALAASPILILIATRADPGHRKFWPIVLMGVVVALPYCYGAEMEADALLDQSKPTCFSATILSMHKTSGKHPTWNLQLDRWGPVAEPDEVHVARSLYDKVSVGERICVVLHNGALGVRWYQVGKCS